MPEAREATSSDLVKSLTACSHGLLLGLTWMHGSSCPTQSWGLTRDPHINVKLYVTNMDYHELTWLILQMGFKLIEIGLK